MDIFPLPHDGADRARLRTYLAHLAGQALVASLQTMPEETVAEMLVTGHFRIRVEVVPLQPGIAPPGQEPAGNNSPRQDPPACPIKLTKLDRHILEHASREPLTMEGLARRCDHDTDSYFQGRVRRLARAGLLTDDYRGYRLPGGISCEGSGGTNSANST